MSSKALILSMYFVALFLVLRNYYSKPGNSGMPKPSVITAPSYLYAVLGLTADFTGGLSTVLAVGLTLGLYYHIHNTGSSPGQSKPTPAKTTATPKVGTTRKTTAPPVPYQIRGSVAAN